MLNRKKLLAFVLSTIPLSTGSTGLSQQTLISTSFRSAADAVPLKDLDGHFPFDVPVSKEAWEARAAELRRQIKVSLGLTPMPTLAPLKPTIHSRREMDGYAVEKFYIESFSGLYVTGSLYSPLDTKGKKLPAVLCPHGHWTNGRFLKVSEGEIKNEIANGAERFESAARSPLQARCVQLARMGCIVLHYDMLGYADSRQIDFNRAHGFGNHGPNPDVPAGQWLLFSSRAEELSQNVMGIQTINTLQLVEYLLSRDDVDPSKLSITGASGGGTQTFIASAIEPRFSGAYPVVMVSTGMQGGCTCENACGLRVGTGNVEIAALTAPKPMGLNAANDWTKNMATDGVPQLKKLYGLYGAADRFTFQSATHFGHNYNHVTRVAMYGFMNRLFGLGLKEPILESDFTYLTPEELSVWDKDHPEPKIGIGFEAEFLSAWQADVEKQLRSSPDLVRDGWLGTLSPANELAKSITKTSDVGFANGQGALIGKLVSPLPATKNVTFCVAFSDDADSDIPDGSTRLNIEDVYGLDSGAVQSLVKNPRLSASYTYGYNAPLAIRRFATLLGVVDDLSKSGVTMELTGTPSTVWMLPAIKLLRPEAKIACKTRGLSYDFASESIRDPKFVPGSIRYLGYDGLLRAAGLDK
ncbi:MAG: acetylxylan esterase [Pirellula sp.]|nr:acetylxylan esterase [Pirellula sp.]